MKRHYTDINGRKRTLTFKENVPYAIRYRKDGSVSTAKRWVDESGSILQIPDDVWGREVKEYRDEV